MNHDALRAAAAEVAYPEPVCRGGRENRALRKRYYAEARAAVSPRVSPPSPEQITALRQLLELLRDELAPKLIPLIKKQAA